MLAGLWAYGMEAIYQFQIYRSWPEFCNFNQKQRICQTGRLAGRCGFPDFTAKVLTCPEDPSHRVNFSRREPSSKFPRVEVKDLLWHKQTD